MNKQSNTHHLSTKIIQLNQLKVEYPVVLAPMSGISDLPFRQLAQSMGAGMVVSEMIASAEFVRGRRKDIARRALGDSISPFVIQLAGYDSHWMNEAARLCEDLGADVIDINMGCPAKEVTGKQSGSALMRDLSHASRLIESVVKSVRVPVTLKMRLGWDEKTINAPELARLAEAAGVGMLTVHGRTRSQFFKGLANWALVRPVKNAVQIPVLVNGDIRDFDDLATALAQSGADGVMVGRGAYGAPWQPGRLAATWRHGTDPGQPTAAQIADIAVQHVEMMLQHYGTALGLRNARKHIGWYLAQFTKDPQHTKQWRQRLCTEENANRLLRSLAEFRHLETTA